MTQETVAASATGASLDHGQSIDRFMAVVGEVIGVGEVSRDQHFLDIGGDSLSMAIIIDKIGQEFSVEPELDWFFDSPTVQVVADKWWGKLQGANDAG
jgi:acyl carrier protein